MPTKARTSAIVLPRNESAVRGCRSAPAARRGRAARRRWPSRSRPGLGDREGRRDRVDGERDVGDDDRHDDEQQRSGIQAVMLADEQASTAELGVTGTVRRTRRRTDSRMGRIPRARRGTCDRRHRGAGLRRGRGRLRALDQRKPGRDRHAAQQQRAGDAERITRPATPAARESR